jgi:predicted acylesterase/phospholipase RssA/CRP-like cAMP-binding protein
VGDNLSVGPEFEALRGYPLIGELDQGDLDIIYPYLSQHVFSDGTIILKQGQSSESFHILLTGQLDVFLETERKVNVAKLKPGQFIGEMSCLTGNAVSASVQAIGEVHTISMPREGILLLMDRSAAFRQHMIEAMVKRIRESNDRVHEEFSRSIAVTRQLELERQAHYGPLLGGGRFMVQLRKQLVELAYKDTPLCIVGERGVGKFHTAYEIHKQSRRAEYPILSVDGNSLHWDDWEMKVRAAREGTIVLEHADLLPLDMLHRSLQYAEGTQVIMTAKAMPNISARELILIPLRERQEDIPELVYAFLTAAGSGDPQEAISNEAMSMLASYPFLDGNIQELKRVVQEAYIVSGGKMILNRHLRFGSVREPGARPKIGLALGSGAARGAAHVGVIKVLEQEGIPIDIIAGTSVGAFIGALYAGGQPISAFEKVLPTVRWKQLLHVALPPKALVHNHPMARFVEKYIGPVHFEDLPIQFAAVASDAVTGEAYIFNKGRVSHAICASTAIPGVIRPVQHGQRQLVDGAVVHPVPVALAKSMGADVVIAIDLSTPELSEPKHFVATILNTIEIMSKKIVTEELQLADIVLKPDITTNQVSFKLSAHNIAMGEKAAREALQSIKNKLSS